MRARQRLVDEHEGTAPPGRAPAVLRSERHIPWIGRGQRDRRVPRDRQQRYCRPVPRQLRFRAPGRARGDDDGGHRHPHREQGLLQQSVDGGYLRAQGRRVHREGGHREPPDRSRADRRRGDHTDIPGYGPGVRALQRHHCQCHQHAARRGIVSHSVRRAEPHPRRYRGIPRAPRPVRPGETNP